MPARRHDDARLGPAAWSSTGRKTHVLIQEHKWRQTDLGDGPADPLPARLERLETANRRTKRMAAWLGQHELHDPAAARCRCKLLGCANLLEFRRYLETGRTRLHAGIFCQQPKLCPVCAARRSSKSLRRHSARVLAVMSAHELVPYLVTHTVSNGPDLLERFEHLHRGLLLSRKRRTDSARGRKSSAWSVADGITASIELKRGRWSGLWHPHCHGCWLLPAGVQCDELQEELRREWKEVTGDSHVVDVRPFHCVDAAAGGPLSAEVVAADLVEVFKYALKLSSMSCGDTWHAHRTLLGRRLVFSLGSLYGVPDPADLADELDDGDGPYLRLLYRFLPGAGRYAQVTGAGEVSRA